MKDFVSRAVAYLQRAGEATQGDTAPVTRAVNPQLVVAYVVDDGDALQFVQQRDLDEAGISADQLHELALANLARLSPHGVKVQQNGPVYGLSVDGNFDASHILMTRLWQENLAHLVERGFAIAIPARGVLVFCDMDSTDGLAMLKDLINRVGNATNYKLSDAIFQIRKRV